MLPTKYKDNQIIQLEFQIKLRFNLQTNLTMKNLKINSTNGKLNLSDLPQNCIFNKVITGCGGTTVALFNDRNYVISVPTTELIVNKTGLNEAGLSTITSPDGKTKVEVFGLFGVFSYKVKKELKEYLSTSGVKKIMCTYDKVAALSKILNPSEYQLLVDEYHILLKAYSYRHRAINGVLSHYKDYKSFCFMSATPISPEFKPLALEGVEEVNAVWDDTDTLFVSLERTNKPYIKAANIINAYKKDGFVSMNGNKSYEAFFFINSVTDIANILQYCELTNDEVKIVCADTDENRRKLAGYTISNSRSENKPFTFITSKSFEGADYFSETGVCYVVSNSSNTNTLLDISTDIYQIAGRIRTETNPFRTFLVHIFNTTGRRNLDLDTSYEEIVERTNKEVERDNKIIEIVNDNPTNSDRLFNKEYVKKDKDGKYYLDEMIVKLDLYTIKLEQSIYKNGISIVKHYNENGILTTNPMYEKLEGTLKSAGKKMSFKEAFLKYAELAKNPYCMDEEAKNHLAAIQPLIVDAYNKLGEDKVRSLKYVKKAIETALLNQNKDNSNEYKVAKILNDYIHIGFISSAELKANIAKAYEILGIIRKAKATDIEGYFDCKATSKRIEGKVTKGYEIYRTKCIFK